MVWLDRWQTSPGRLRRPSSGLLSRGHDQRTATLRQTNSQTGTVHQDLWAKLGETGALPETRTEASAEIRRLKGRKRLSRAERSREAFEARREAGERYGDDAAVRADEISGYGSTATWR